MPAPDAGSRKLIPVVCTLGAVDADAQLKEWTAIRSHARSVARIPNGARFEVAADLHAAAADLAEREMQCCTFLDIAVTRGADRVTIEITSESPDAGPVIDALVGAGDTSSA